ncbi:heme peroxidase [Entophlyctis helioformis]|nr:heme peroxidase [Entophlyctis helioformis]
MDINKPTVASTTTTVATTTTTVAVVDTQPSNIPSVQALQSATNSLVSFIDTREGCMASRLHLKEDEPSRNLAALWLRAAFHDAGTFDPSNAAAPGGADGSLAKMLDDPLHKGIKASIARNFLINPKSKISDADLIAMAGIVTVTHCGGPEIPFKAGREDAVVPVSPKGRLPDDLDGYASIKAAMRRMGFTNEDMVALVVGGHSLGGAHAGISPHVTSEPFVPFDSTPGIFDNDIFKQLLAGNCRLNVDCGIANDPELRPLVEKYAADQAAFFAQFAASYGKMTGFTRSQIMKEHVKLIIPLHKNLVQEGTVNVTFPSKTTTTAAVVSKATSTAVVAPLVSTAVSVSATVEPSASAVPPVIHASESHAPSPVPTGNTGYGYTGDSNGKTDDHDHDHKGKNTDGYADSPILSHASSSVSGIMLTAVSAVLSVAALFMA